MTLKRYLKSEHTKNRRTDRRTFQLIESIVTEGRCFGKTASQDKSTSKFMRPSVAGYFVKRLDKSILSTISYFSSPSKLRLHELTDYAETKKG